MSDFELGRLRAVGLSPYDINVLSTLVAAGGEIPFFIERVAPETRNLHVAGMSSLADRNLIEVDEARSTVTRWILRLTDNGRAVYSKLEEMRVKPAVEVQMHGDVPEVIK